MGIQVRPGDVIDGAYVVERLLGQGGMGAVYVAREERLARRVAIKVLTEGHDSNPEALARFEREARSAAALQSDHAARVYSVGHLPNRTPYIVMELLEGEDLAGLLARRGLLPAHEVVSMMLQVCDALSEAHALGIVHRDLKPANIFVARRPSGATTIKVLDFGISKGVSSGATVSPLTGTKAVMGTPLYMSPEQVREVRAVDARTDVWALGGVMFELLTGRSPFHAETLPDVFQRILEENPQTIAQTRPDVTPALEAVVMQCLEKDPRARFASARELAAALASVSASPSAPHLSAAAPHGAVGPHAATAAMAAGAPTPAPQQGSAAATVAAQARNAYAQPVVAPAAPPMASSTPPIEAMMPAPQNSGPAPTPPAPMHALAGTVDPLVFRTGATTRAADPTRPSMGVIFGVFFGVVAAAGLVIYLAVFRTGSDDKGPAAANASTSAAPSAASSVPASTAASASAIPSASSAPVSTATHARPTSPGAPGATAVAPISTSTSALGKPPPPAPPPNTPPGATAMATGASPLPPSQPPIVIPTSPPPQPQTAPANSGKLGMPSRRTD